jgi:hypothetical protein
MYHNKIAFTLIALTFGATVPAISIGSEAVSVLTTLSAKELSGGANCSIVSESGKTLVESNVKINGVLIPIKTLSITPSTKAWSGKDVELEFSLPKGKLKEKSDGSFSVGTSSIGTLKGNYKGSMFEMKAREECSAP